MSKDEERLQEIKDSLNAQYEIAKSDNKYQSVYFVLDEEKELIEEIERLKDLIKALWNNNSTSNLNDKQLELLDNIIFDKEKDNE